MKAVIIALVVVFGFAQQVFAQTTFMELWCEYGGKGCAPQTRPQEIRPVAPSAQTNVAPVPVPVVKVQSSAPLITRNAAMMTSGEVRLGRYYALVIGNNAYPNLPDLKSAIHDAVQVGHTLKGLYGFSVTRLENATRDQIIAALDEYRKILREEDNLLIYYAGHGWMDEESERGYWLPVDADKETRARWLSNADVTDTLKALKARHVLVVADSCYAGTLTRSAEGLGVTRGLKLVEQPGSYLATMLSKKSRTVLSSGALEPVSDQGGGKHSVFAYAFLKSLKENKQMMDGTQLFGEVRKQVMLSARQTPQYSDIRFAGHDVGGDFVFMRRDN